MRFSRLPLSNFSLVCHNPEIFRSLGFATRLTSESVPFQNRLTWDFSLLVYFFFGKQYIQDFSISEFYISGIIKFWIPRIRMFLFILKLKFSSTVVHKY